MARLRNFDAVTTVTSQNGITLDNSLLVFIQSEALLQWLGPLGPCPMSRYLLLISCLESWYLNLLNVTKQWCSDASLSRVSQDICWYRTWIVCKIISGMNRQLHNVRKHLLGSVNSVSDIIISDYATMFYYPNPLLVPGGSVRFPSLELPFSSNQPCKL